ncbi:MAG: hypothetical protein KJZ55_10265, partial [Flavobacteriales bacterium]|nr:hypothetical protein [Flavobacteriales bacterium]
MIGNAQFNFTGFPINTYARTTVPMQKVAIGNFPTNASVQAKLHVNQFLLANNPVTDGLMFRTDGSNTISNSWQLYTGATIGSVTEKFRLFVPANSDDVNLQASQNGARMIFGINGPGILGGSAPITRMVITDGAFFGNTGLIGMGNGFLNPQSQLHLYDGVFSTYLQITNFATNASALNPSATDGFKLGIAADGTAEIRQQENLAMDFFTANTERMHINEDNGLTDGFIGMGNGFNNPQSLLHLNNPLNEETWLQITNVDVGESTTDGLRLGILDETPGQPSFGYLRWQEASPFIIQTQNVENQNLNSERIRITTNQGNPDPFNPEGDNTRIGISNRGEEHITLIRSLLHLGYNTGFLINNINATDGWRNW